MRGNLFLSVVFLDQNLTKPYVGYHFSVNPSLFPFRLTIIPTLFLFFFSSFLFHFLVMFSLLPPVHLPLSPPSNNNNSFNPNLSTNISLFHPTSSNNTCFIPYFRVPSTKVHFSTSQRPPRTVRLILLKPTDHPCP